MINKPWLLNDLIDTVYYVGDSMVDQPRKRVSQAPKMLDNHH